MTVPLNACPSSSGPRGGLSPGSGRADARPSLMGSFQPHSLFLGQGSSRDKGSGWPKGVAPEGCGVAHHLGGEGCGKLPEVWGAGLCLPCAMLTAASTAIVRGTGAFPRLLGQPADGLSKQPKHPVLRCPDGCPPWPGTTTPDTARGSPRSP